MNRKSARDMAFKILYISDIQKESFDVIYDIQNQENEFDSSSSSYIQNVLNGISEHAMEINDIIAKNSDGWKLNRISKITLACLKLGIFEVLFDNDIPNTVAINESVGIAKTYEGEESAKFVNGILSTVLKENA